MSSYGAARAGRYKTANYHAAEQYLVATGFRRYRNTSRGMVFTQVNPGSNPDTPPSLVARANRRGVIEFFYSLKDCGCDG